MMSQKRRAFLFLAIIKHPAGSNMIKIVPEGFYSLFHICRKKKEAVCKCLLV